MNKDVGEGFGCLLILLGIAVVIAVSIGFGCHAINQNDAVHICGHIKDNAVALADCIKAAKE